MVYHRRTLESYAERATAQFPVLLITGARQVGKTTFLQHLSAGKRSYVTLDDPLVLNLAKEDPALFFQRFPPPVLIDEIQYAPELLPYIKISADNEKIPGQFWLTGSQQFHLMKGVSESLAGRVAVLQLLGFSRNEFIGRNTGPFIVDPHIFEVRVDSGDTLTLKELFKHIWKGSFPALCLNETADKQLFYSSYLQTYLQRDIHDLARVGDQIAFTRFLRAVAARTGQLLNFAELAKDTGIAPNTAKHWISILESSGIVFLLEAFHTSVTTRLVKAPKLFMLDTGLCSYLTEWTSPETLEAGAMSGAILETWVLSELIKSYLHNGRRAPFYFYRDKDQKEIDLLIYENGSLCPIEIKKTASPRKDDVRHFRVLEGLNLPIKDGGLICLAKQLMPLGPNAWSIPVSAI